MLNGGNLNSCSRARGRARLLLQKYVEQRNILQLKLAIGLQEEGQQTLKISRSDKEDVYKKKIAVELEESKLQEVSSCLNLEFSKQNLKGEQNKLEKVSKKEFKEQTEIHEASLRLNEVFPKSKSGEEQGHATFFKREFNRKVIIPQQNVERIHHEYRQTQSEELEMYDNTPTEITTECQTSEEINNVEKHREKKYETIQKESILKVKVKRQLREMFEKILEMSTELRPETQTNEARSHCEEGKTNKVEMLKHQLKLNVQQMIQKRNNKVKLENERYCEDKKRKEEKMRKHQMIQNIKELNGLQIFTGKEEKKLKKQMKLVITEVSQLSCSNSFV